MKAMGKRVLGETIGETEGARRATGVFPIAALSAKGEPETEVTAKAHRRRFTAEYKRRILCEADRCTESGALGALLRREGLYSSNLTTWRAACPEATSTAPTRATRTCGTSSRVKVRAWH